jgi:hypothetical protein
LIHQLWLAVFLCWTSFNISLGVFSSHFSHFQPCILPKVASLFFLIVSRFERVKKWVTPNASLQSVKSSGFFWVFFVCHYFKTWNSSWCLHILILFLSMNNCCAFYLVLKLVLCPWIFKVCFCPNSFTFPFLITF